MIWKILSIFFLSITLLVSSYSISYPQESFAQTTTLDVAGKWDGTIEFKVTFDYYPDRVTCIYSGTATATIDQSGNNVSGTIGGDVKLISGDTSVCGPEFASAADGSINGKLFGSSFTGTVGLVNFQGSFTSDTFSGTFSKPEQSSGDVGVIGEITLNKLGFKPDPIPLDSDGDGTIDLEDRCPKDPNKTFPGIGGCGVSDEDYDGDGTIDAQDGCPKDRNKTSPGSSGCGVSDTEQISPKDPEILDKAKPFINALKTVANCDDIKTFFKVSFDVDNIPFVCSNGSAVLPGGYMVKIKLADDLDLKFKKMATERGVKWVLTQVGPYNKIIAWKEAAEEATGIPKANKIIKQVNSVGVFLDDGKGTALNGVIIFEFSCPAKNCTISKFENKGGVQQLHLLPTTWEGAKMLAESSTNSLFIITVYESQEIPPLIKKTAEITIDTNKETFAGGDTVILTGMVGDGNEGDLVALEVKDPLGETMLIRTVSLGPDTTFELEFKIPPSGEAGSYDIIANAEVGGETVTETKTISKSSGTENGCLIATATFGSEQAIQVQQLRELRDNTLLQTESGTSFMAGFNQFYYSFSPTIADWERQNPVFKETVKIAITPLLTSLSLLNYVDIDSEAEMLGYGISLILLNVGMYFVGPTILLLRIIKRKDLIYLKNDHKKGLGIES